MAFMEWLTKRKKRLSQMTRTELRRQVACSPFGWIGP